MVSNQEKIAAGARELELHKELIKVATTSDRIISAVQTDRASASSLQSEIVSLAKAAGYVNNAADEAQLKSMLDSHAGTAKVACQILREISTAQKAASATKDNAPAGFVVASGGNGRPVSRQANDSGEEDVIGKYASSLR
jgi:hypothetical protein